MVKLGDLDEFTTANKTLEIVDSLTFLGAKIDRDGGCMSGIATRIAPGKQQ